MHNYTHINRYFEERTLLSNILERIPNILYKYRSWNDELEKSIITKNELFLASPASFDDEYDCKLDFDFNASKKDKFDYYLEISSQEHQSFNRQQHRTWAQKKCREHIMDNPAQQKKFKTTFYEEYAKHLGILSLSSVIEDEQMWSNFTKDDSGFALGLYSKSLLYLKPAISGGGEISYCDPLPKIKCTDKCELKYYLNVFTKHKSHNFEHEYRLVNANVKQRNIQYPEDAIAELILAPDISSDAKKEICSAMSKHHPNVPIKQAILVDNKIIIQ